MMKTALFAAGLALLASPAAATEWVYCNDTTSTVTVGLLLGSEPMAVAGIILSHGDRVWASAAAYGPGEPIGLRQGFENETMFFADLDDGNGTLLAEVRLLKATEGDTYVSGGTLRLPGAGAWVVSCEGP